MRCRAESFSGKTSQIYRSCLRGSSRRPSPFVRPAMMNGTDDADDADDADDDEDNGLTDKMNAGMTEEQEEET